MKYLNLVLGLFLAACSTTTLPAQEAVLKSPAFQAVPPAESAKPTAFSGFAGWPNSATVPVDLTYTGWDKMMEFLSEPGGLQIHAVFESADRATTEPVYIGQLGTETDTGIIYRADGLTGADWKFLSYTSYPVRTEAEFNSAITALGTAIGTINIISPITLTSKVYVPDNVTLKFHHGAYFDFNDNTDLLEIHGSVEAPNYEHIFRNTLNAGGTGTPPSVYGSFAHKDRKASWWLGKPYQGLGIYVSPSDPGNYNQVHLQAAIDSGYTTLTTFTSRYIFSLIIDGAYHFNQCTVTISNRRVRLKADDENRGHASIIVNGDSATTQMLDGDFILTWSESTGNGYYESIQGIGIQYVDNDGVLDLGCLRLYTSGGGGNYGVQEFARIKECNLGNYSSYGLYCGPSAIMNGFEMDGCTFGEAMSPDAVAIYLDSAGSRFATQHAKFSNITINHTSSGGNKTKYGIVNKRGGGMIFENIHVEDVSVAYHHGSETSNVTGSVIINHLDLNGDGLLFTGGFGALQSGANFADGDTLGINGKTYTMQSVLTDVDGNILIGARSKQSFQNIQAAITLGSGAGSTYAASMTAPPAAITDAEYFEDRVEIHGTSAISATYTPAGTAGAQVLSAGILHRVIEIEANSTGGAMVQARQLHRASASNAAGFMISDSSFGGYVASGTTQAYMSVTRAVSRLSAFTNVGTLPNIAVPDAATTAALGGFSGTLNNVCLPYMGAEVMYQFTPTAALTITGMQNMPTLPGDVLFRIVNLSLSNTITLSNNNGGSAVGLRFRCPGGVNYTIPVAGSAVLRYDSTLAAWVVQ